MAQESEINNTNKPKTVLFNWQNSPIFRAPAIAKIAAKDEKNAKKYIISRARKMLIKATERMNVSEKLFAFLSKKYSNPKGMKTTIGPYQVP